MNQEDWPRYPDRYRGNRRFLFPKTFLYKLHVLQRLNPRQISEIHKKELGIYISSRAVREYLKKYGLYNTAPPQRTKILKGESWEYQPKHKLANRYGRVKLKILVMEEKYGIAFNSKKHLIRFLDGNSLNCDPENIKLIHKRWQRNRKQDVVIGAYYVSECIRRSKNYKPYLDSLSQRFRFLVLNKLFHNMAKKKAKQRLKKREKLALKFIIRNYGISWGLAEKVITDRELMIDWPKIEEIIKNKGLSYSEFCRRANITYMRYYLIRKKGTIRKGYRKTVLRVSKALKVHPKTISKECTNE